ncbi:MAG: radical SAM protein [Spirochaetota bacterium]
MNGRYCILDCYVDEPACFGVPPFVSPYPRYVYGALLDGGAASEQIAYRTIDQLREWDFRLDEHYTAVFLIGGAVVPGKYLGQKIGTTVELERIVTENATVPFLSGGPAARMMSNVHNNLYRVTGDIEQYAFTYLCGSAVDGCRSYVDLNRWARLGSSMVRHHPHYPDIICEIESYRGCPRSRHCSFCSEKLYGSVEYRDQEDILAEVDSLIESGVSRFRLGRQADILAYKSSAAEYIDSFPRPNPDEVVPLFHELSKRRLDGRISVLNVDNANPGTIAHFERESHDILTAIAAAVSPGDTLPLGIESFDPAVIARNNLKIGVDDFFRVVRLMNDAGGHREDGVPKLLPGVNLIHGLPGENMETFRMNFEALHEAAERGLLLKRINIRTLVPYDTSGAGRRLSASVTSRYRYFRNRIRREIDHHMLSRVYPHGAVLRDVKWVGKRYDVSYGRQIASYAITVKTRMEVPSGTFSDTVVCNHAERSLEGFIPPLHLNEASVRQLEAVYGIGKNMARTIVARRPFTEQKEAETHLQTVPDALRRHLQP